MLRSHWRAAATAVALAASPAFAAPADSIADHRFQFVDGELGPDVAQSVFAFDVTRMTKSGDIAIFRTTHWPRSREDGGGSSLKVVIVTDWRIDCKGQTLQIVERRTYLADSGKLSGTEQVTSPMTRQAPKAENGLGLMEVLACSQKPIDGVAEVKGLKAARAYVEAYFRDNPKGGPLPVYDPDPR